MTFTASSNVDDSHDALSSTVDCASTSKDKNVISTQITKVKRKVEESASDMLTNCNYITDCNSSLTATALPILGRRPLGRTLYATVH